MDHTGLNVRLICNTLQVPHSSYYHATAPTQSQLDDARMGQAIRTIFQQRYGHRRIWKQLATLQPRTLYTANQRWPR